MIRVLIRILLFYKLHDMLNKSNRVRTMSIDAFSSVHVQVFVLVFVPILVPVLLTVA